MERAELEGTLPSGPSVALSDVIVLVRASSPRCFLLRKMLCGCGQCRPNLGGLVLAILLSPSKARSPAGNWNQMPSWNQGSLRHQ